MFTREELILIGDSLATEYKETLADIDWWDLLNEEDRQVTKEELQNHLTEIAKILKKIKKILDI